MRTALAILLAATLAAPAAAEAPPLPDCHDTMLSPAERRVLGVPAEGYEYGYFVIRLSPEHAFYTIRHQDTQDTLNVIEHCPTRERLTAMVRRGTDAEGDWYDRLDRVEQGLRDRGSDTNPQSWTLRGLAAWAQAQGAEARVARVDIASCACGVLGPGGN